MKINVPVIATHDVLIIGGTVKAIRLALDLRDAGYTVFMAAAHPYFGEDLCGTLDLQSRKTADYKTLFGDTRMRTPAEMKHTFDRRIIDAGIDFLFQLRPVRPVYDADEKVCGALFADRSGFHAVVAKVVVDATQRQTFARSAGIPTRPFTPGTYSFTLFGIGGVNEASSQLTVQKLPQSVVSGNQSYPAYRVCADIRLDGNTVFDIARAVVDFRREAWSGTGVAYGDVVVMDLQDGVIDDYRPSIDSPVVLVDRTTAGRIAALVEKRPAPAPVGFGEQPGDRPFDVVRKDAYFRFRDCPMLPFDLNAIPVIGDCDVFVAGGGTGGAPAAIGAARGNMRTICAENLPSLGGVMLAGRIGSYYYGNRVGFTHEIDTGIQHLAPNPDFSIEKGQMNVVWKNHWLMSKAAEKGARIVFDAMTVAAVVEGTRACGAVLLTPEGIGVVTASFVIDATGNCDFAAAAGAAIACELKDEAAIQGAGLSPIVLGRNYSNTDYTFVLDDDVVDATRAFVMAHGKFSGEFDVSSILNTRERRRIVGDLVLQPMDFFANRRYADTINVAMSNFDTHGFIIHPMFMLKPTAHESRFADVPLRALLPLGFDGLAVTGLGVSAHRDCMPLIRMQPDVQNQGYAMGRAAAMAVKSRRAIREIDIRALQKKLIAEDILPQRVLEETDTPCVPIENDPYHAISRVFQDPATAVSGLRQTLSANPSDVETATTLAFLGDDSGRRLLIETILASDWDAGWDFRGMGQFGPSMSPLDAKIIALANIGGDTRSLLSKLATLDIASAFSHIRAVSLALIRNPVFEATDALEKILEMPGATGHAVLSFQDALASNRPEINDTSVRNAQLKEIYLAKALAACNPGSQIARTILDAYIKGMQGLFTRFASA